MEKKKMKIWKIIRDITVIMLILFIGYIAYRGIMQFTDGNYYSDSMGVMVYYWYDRFLIELLFICLTNFVPIFLDIMLFIVSIIRMKEIKENRSREKGKNK